MPSLKIAASFEVIFIKCSDTKEIPTSSSYILRTYPSITVVAFILYLKNLENYSPLHCLISGVNPFAAVKMIENYLRRFFLND